MDVNPFDAIAAQDDAAPAVEKAPETAPIAPKPPETENIFDKIAAKDDQPETSVVGAAAVSAGKGLVPALAGVVPGAATGAELGGAAGSVLGPVGIGVGGFVGGLAGGFAGGAAVQKAQDWALSQLPHGWTDPLNKYEQAAQEQHKTASFIGGLAPFALTSWPVGAAKAGETALERLMADPITSRLFGGALMGGLELGQQKLRGEEADWTDVAISTGFGVMFNKPTALGERLHKIGAGAAAPAAEAFRAPMAAAEVLAHGRNLPRPDETTLADVWSTGIVGTGATEETASGVERMADEAKQAAQDAVRAELPEPEPDLHVAARAWAPEVFERADALDQERDHLRTQINDLLNPPDRVVEEAERARDELQAQYDAHLAAAGGYTGDRTGRQLRAKIREAQREVDTLGARREAWETGQAQDTEAITALRQRLTEITHERMDVGREIAAALRHAEENAGRAPPEQPEIVEPEPVTGKVTVTPEATAPVERLAKPEASPPRTPPEMRQRIAEDVAERLKRADFDPEKAAAWGQLIAARYATRAAWRSDLSAEELYHKEGLNFRRIAYEEFQRERAQAGRKAKAALKPKDGEIVVNGQKITGEAAAQLAKKIEEAERTAPRTTEAIEPLIVNGQEVTGEAAMLLRKAMERAAAPVSRETLPEPVVESPKPISAEELRGQAIKEPQTLLGFIRGMGGVKDWKGELKAADLHKRYPGLVNNKHGQALDAAREAAEEAGYLPENSTPDDLVRALLSDEPVYSAQDQDIAQTYRIQEASRDKMRAIKDARAELSAPEFEGHNPEILDEAAWLMVEEGLTPDAALETASIRAILPLAKELDYELADIFEAEIDRAANSARNREAETARLPAGEEIPKGLGVAFEPGAEGKPQQLIPGVEPVTDRERAELEAGKPLRGGNAALPAGGLFDEEAINQQELFQGEKKAAIHLPTRMVSLFEHADFSSIAHEGGHDFLRQMQEDIRHPDAPQQLKDDFRTVLDWMNKGRGKPSTAENIQERHHEKFARAWEHYIMEGRAPSKELASVFEKMKQWMLDIYQAVVGNRIHPINAEVRAVFDRLLTEEPHARIVEAEVPPREPTLSDVHVADAETIEPQDALPAADQIAVERARAEQEAPQEIADEIAPAVAEVDAERAAAAESRGIAGEGAGGRGEMGAGSEKAGPVTIGGEMGARAGEKRPSGNAVAPESRSVVGKEQSGREPPAGSAERLAPRSWDNIIGKPNVLESVDNLIKEIGNGDPELEQDLRARAETMDFSKVTNGRVTWDQHEEWARATGMPVHELTDRHFGEAWNSRQMYFAAETINQLNQEIWQARQTGDAIANVVEYERKKALRDALINQFVGARAEAGRALNIFKALKQQFGDTMDETFFQTWREITGKEFSRSKDESEAVSKLTNKDAVAQFLHNSKERTFGRMAFEYWMCSIVSNYVSQLTDTVGAFVTAASKLTVEAPLAAALGAAKGEAQRVRASEAVAGWKAVPGALPAATKAAIDTLRTGQLTHLPGQELQSAVDLGYYGVGEPLKEGAALADVKESAFGLMTGISDAIRAMGAIQPGAPLVKAIHTERGMVPNLEIKGAEMPLGDFLRSPLNFLKSMEAFSASMAFAVEKNMIAYRTAVNEGHKAEALKQRIGELMTNPPPELIEEAVKEARYNALAYRGGKVSGAFAGWLNQLQVKGWPVGRFVVPFVNISSIMMNEALLKRTPLGFLSKEIRADLTGANGKIAQQKAQARMMVGTSIGLMAMSMAASGIMTGSAPSDPKERALWVAAGKQPYSIKIGDNWYSYKRLGVFGLHLGIFADMFLVSQQAIEEKSLSDGIGSAIHAVAKNVIDQSYFKGPSDLLRAVTEKGYGEYYVRNFLSGFVPFSGGMGQTAQLIDPYSRQARSVADAIMSKIPIVSERLPQRLDIFGRPLPSRDPWGPFAIWSQEQSKDPVINEMMRLEYYPAQVGKAIRGVDLTDAQHDEFARIAGAVAHENLNRIVASPQWSRLPDGIKKDLMETAVRRSRESVRGWMMSKYRDIPTKAYQLKRERLQ